MEINFIICSVDHSERGEAPGKVNVWAPTCPNYLILRLCQINASELNFSNSIGILGVKIYLMRQGSQGREIYQVVLWDLNGNNALSALSPGKFSKHAYTHAKLHGLSLLSIDCWTTYSRLWGSPSVESMDFFFATSHMPCIGMHRMNA